MRVPVAPPSLADVAEGLSSARLAAVLVSGVRADDHGRYRHWDTLRHVSPPAGLSAHEWWLAIQSARRVLRRELPLRTTSGQPFAYALTDAAHEMLQRIDQQAAGRLTAPEQVTNPHVRDRYVISSLIEEAITSSQLEGASSTRQVAKEMLRTGRAPRDRSERMIFGNYHAMELVRQWRDRRLTPEMVCDLHRVATEGTLRNPSAAGRVQTPDEERVTVLWSDGTVLHRPPPAEQLPGRLEAMCRFANGDQVEGFLHPVVRAILLHFWLAYDHPFEDGNGRTARALFYWSMLSQGLWLTEFLSISSILRGAPARYARSFLYTETDAGDTTYFILSQLRVICRAIDALNEYLSRKATEVAEVEALLRRAPGFNHRQLALLGHALRTPGAEYTYASHARSHGVVHQSARTDLIGLRQQGLLDRTVRGTTHRYFAPLDLERRLRAIAASRARPSASD
ncbi:MAG: Fic family protein [Actinomycetota bacterium]|nr:Fic family protein [Actinomycetota bacterium]